MNRPSPFFSIITPVLNGSTFVEPFFKAIFSQVFTDWELLIVDDGSQDNTLLNLYSFSRDDPRVFIYKNHFVKRFSGPYSARNFALDKVNGQYVCFLDIDDHWLPEHLQKYYDLLSSNKDLKFLCSSYFVRKHNSNKLDTRFVSKILPLNRLIYFFNPIPMLTSCISCELVDNLRFRPIGHEDFMFWLGFVPLLKSTQYAILDESTSVYLCRPRSQSSDKLKSLWWSLRIFSITSNSFVVFSFRLFVFCLYHLYSCLLRLLFSFSFPLLLFRLCLISLLLWLVFLL